MLGIRGQKAIQYVFFEMLPGFLLGLAVFVSIILMFQVLRLTDFALVHGVDLKTISQIVGYICISMLPALFPMSLLFAVLMTYGRLSSDSEIVAMKASGLHMGVLTSPALILGLLVSLLSAQTSFEIAPWGNRQFEVLFTRLGNTKAAANIKAGTFSQGFFDMVIYSNEVDSERGLLKDVFIYDEKTDETPLTIIARAGQIIPDTERPGHQVLLRLTDGDIHRKGLSHTKIKFDTYDLKLVDPIKQEEREMTPPSMTLKDLKAALALPHSEETKRIFQTEVNKRWAISFLCPIFALLGVGLGTTTNRRSQKAGGMIMCILLIIVYWIMYIAFEGLARSGKLPPQVAIWAPNFLFTLFAFESLRRNWN